MWDHTEAENLMFMSLSTLHNSCYNYITRLVSGNIYASLQSYCHTKLVSLSEGRHSRTYGLWMLLKWGRLRSSLGSVKTRPPSPLRIPAWIPRHRRNIFLLLVTMTHKSDSGDKLRTIQQKRFLPLKSNKSFWTQNTHNPNLRDGIPWKKLLGPPPFHFDKVQKKSRVFSGHRPVPKKFTKIWP